MTEMKTLTIDGKTYEVVDETARTNISELTPADIDAAPAGYGLGEFCTVITDWNTAVRNGWYRTTTLDANNNGPSPFAWYGIVTAYSSELVMQDVYHRVQNGISMHCRRWMYAGAWDPWEWENPPMVLNEEYRTTERINNLVVYKKNIDGVTYYRLDGETEWKPYADAVGAVKKSGDTMTGPLKIVHPAGTNALDLIMHSNHALIRNVKDSGYTQMTLPPSLIDGAIHLHDIVDGEVKADYVLLHTGNKPFGSYTGNGSDTERTIDTGGIGNMIVIYTSTSIAFVTFSGALCCNLDNGVITCHQNAKFHNGVLTLTTTGDYVNVNGNGYNYQVL